MSGTHHLGLLHPRQLRCNVLIRRVFSTEDLAEPSQVLEIHPVRERKVHKGRVGWLKMTGSALGTHPLQPHGLLDYVVLRLDRPLPAIPLLDLIEGTV